MTSCDTNDKMEADLTDGPLELLEEESWDEECDANASAFIPNSTTKIDDNPNEVPTTKHEEIIKKLLQFVAITVEETIYETVQIADRLILLQKKYKEEGLEFPNDLSWNIWWSETKELQTRLENLNLSFDEGCPSIFAHQFFLNAVCVYPIYSYDISYLLLGYLENGENSKRNKDNIVKYILDYIYLVFEKSTVYDHYVDPPDVNSEFGSECLARRDLLEIEFPALKFIKGNKRILMQKLRARYLNTANFFANIMYVIHDRGYEKAFHKFLRCLTKSMDVTKFLAVDQILGLCGFLIKDNKVLNACLTRLADFLGGLDPNHPMKVKLRLKLKKIYLELVKKPKMEIPNKLKLLYQIYPSQMKPAPPEPPTNSATIFVETEDDEDEDEEEDVDQETFFSKSD